MINILTGLPVVQQEVEVEEALQGSAEEAVPSRGATTGCLREAAARPAAGQGSDRGQPAAGRAAGKATAQQRQACTWYPSKRESRRSPWHWGCFRLK